jgi:hypothetical protein
MTTQATPEPSRSSAGPDVEPGGWAIFAAIVLVIAGTLDALWGLAEIINGHVVTVAGGHVLLWSFVAWGWIHLIVGVLMVATGFGLLTMQDWARWAAVFFAAINAILQIGNVTAFPLWSLIIIALDVIVIYHLTERWDRHVGSSGGRGMQSGTGRTGTAMPETSQAGTMPPDPGPEPRTPGL